MSDFRSISIKNHHLNKDNGRENQERENQGQLVGLM